MANALTGDYDVIAAFSLGAVNRILAAMHRGKRLPHSLSVAVNDFPRRPLGVTAFSVVNVAGQAVTDAAMVKYVAYHAKPATPLKQEMSPNVDPVVNAPLPPERPMPTAAESDDDCLSGVAQIQLAAPKIQISPTSSASAEIHTPVMIRYVADSETRPLSQFMRGEFVVSFGVKDAPAGGGSNIVLDLAGAGNIQFNSGWSAASLSPGDRAAIDTALSEALRDSLQPSSTPRPSSIRALNLKSFAEAQAVAVLMNVASPGHPDPDSVTMVSMNAGDQFTLTVNGDAIAGPFAAAVNGAIDSLGEQDTDTTVPISANLGFTTVTRTFHVYTKVTISDAIVELGDDPALDPPGIPGTGQITLTIPVHVGFGWKDKPFFVPDPKDFDFTIVQVFRLTLNGREVGLETVGGVEVNIPKDVPRDRANTAGAQAAALFNNAWKSQQGAIQRQINKALGAGGLESLVKSMMNPVAGPGTEEIDPRLEYTSFEIQPEGIVLHGTLAVTEWPAAACEFELDPRAGASRPQYNALNCWIPGGTIAQYQWSFQDAGPVADNNRFVMNGPALTLGRNSISLTVAGSRITASGPVCYCPVTSARAGRFTSFPQAALARNKVDPDALMAVTAGGAREPGLNVIGHVSPVALHGAAPVTANFLVHFPDRDSAGHLHLLPKALAQSGRTDTATAILCVLTDEQVSSVRAAEGLIYASSAGPWEKLFQIDTRPATVLLSPAGEVLWRYAGGIDDGLAEALRAHLAPGGQFFPRFIEPALTIGQPAPNFLFEAAPGEPLTLRKLVGKPVALVFWRSSSPPCIATIRNLHTAFTQPGVAAPLLLAIADAEDAKSAHDSGLVAKEIIVVPDPARQIAQAYGIGMWPTTVFLDAHSKVAGIRLGLISAEELQTSLGSKAAPASGSAPRG
jgi:thiol-disulfide isomerase/thioredoxin